MKKKLAVIALACYAFAATLIAAPQPVNTLVWKGRYLSNHQSPGAQEFISYVQNLNGLEQYDITSEQWKSEPPMGGDVITYRQNIHNWAIRAAANLNQWVVTARVTVDFELSEGVIVYKHTTIDHYPADGSIGGFNAMYGSYSTTYPWQGETWSNWTVGSFMVRAVNPSPSAQAVVLTVTPTGLPPEWVYWDQFKAHYLLMPPATAGECRAGTRRG